MAYLGHRPAVGENNSFRILDDISSYVLTFDGSSASVVSLSNETITMTDDKHRYITGQRVTYSNGGGGNITGLSNGQAYFVINHSSTEIKLASSASNALAGTAVDLTGLGTGSSHTLTLAFDGVNTKFVPTFGNGLHDTLIKRAAQLVISLNGVIQQPHDTATPTTGFGVDALGNLIFSTAPASTDIFWAHVLASNTVTFDSSDNDVDTFTGNGSTTSFTLSKVPPDNRNILVTIDGVVQYPSDAANTRSYNVSENVMTFVSAPGNGTVIQVRHIGYAGPTAGGGSGGVTGFYGRTGNVALVSTDNIVANNATFSGNVSIAKTLTYEDVTDIDSVGLITARSGIKDQTLTAGHVVFAGTGGRLSGEADLFYDASNNRLGIGTDDPSTQLQIVGYTASADSTGGTLGIRQKGDSKNDGITLTSSHANSARFWKDSDGALHIYNTGGNVNDFVLTNAGQIGIGTDDPKTKLNVYTYPNADTGGILVQNANYASNVDKAYLIAGTQNWTGAATDWNTYGFQHKLKSNSSGTPRLTIDASSGSSNLIEIITFTHQGRVGIGSDDPQKTLDIYSGQSHGSIRVHNLNNGGTGYDAELSLLGSASNSEMRINMGVNSDPDREQIKSYQSDLIFKTATEERLRITSTGQTLLTRGSQGGRDSTGNFSNFMKIGTWYGIDQTSRLKITIFGTATYDSNADVAGETIIYISSNANYTLKGHFHSHSNNRNCVQKVAFKYDSGTTSCEVWIKYNGSYSCTQHKVDASEGYWVGADVDTGSTSVPSGATEASSFFSVATSNGSQSYERFRIASTGYVGIQTADPKSFFHASRPSTCAVTLNFGDPAAQILQCEDSEFALGLHNTNPYPLFIQGRTRVNQARQIVLNPLGGNIGIGTLNPVSALDVRNASGTDPLLSLHHSEADVEGEVIRIGRVAPYHTIRYHSIKAEHSGGTASNMLAFNLHVGGSNTTDQVEVMRLQGNGRVVLGHTAANARLHIASGTSAAVGDASNPAFQVGSTSNYRFGIYTDDETAFLYNKNGDDGIHILTKETSGGNATKFKIHADQVYGVDNYARTGTGNQSNHNQAHPTGAIEWQNNTDNGINRYNCYIQATGGNETDMYITVRNSSFYRITVKASHNSTSADVAMYLVYGLNSTVTGNRVHEVTDTGQFSCTNHNTHVNSHDSTIKISYGGSANQGLRAFVETIGGF